MPGAPDDLPTAPTADAEDEIDFAGSTLRELLTLLGLLDTQIEAREPQTPGDGVGRTAQVFEIFGDTEDASDELGLLIGRRGETLGALQYLLNVITRHHYGEANHVFAVDVEGYKRRRETSLVEMAQRVAAEVRETGDVITLEPMKPAERRIVHLTLSEEPGVTTESVGSGNDRQVEVLPADYDDDYNDYDEDGEQNDDGPAAEHDGDEPCRRARRRRTRRRVRGRRVLRRGRRIRRRRGIRRGRGRRARRQGRRGRRGAKQVGSTSNVRERHSSHGAPDGGLARAPSVLIAGAATWDLIAEERRPGGPIVYGARAAAALGVRAQLLTIARPDSDFEALRGHDATIAQASHTLSFVHTFSPEASGSRELRLLARPERALSASDLPPSRAGGDALDLLVLAPLLADDLDLASFAGVRARRRALLAQGLLRDVGADGLITHAAAPSDLLLDAVDGRTSVFLSEDEIADWDAHTLSTLAGAAERVVVTRGARGATVLRGGTRLDTPAHTAVAVDSTGCGDVVFGRVHDCARPWRRRCRSGGDRGGARLGVARTARRAGAAGRACRDSLGSVTWRSRSRW